MANILFVEEEQFLMETFMYRLQDEGHTVTIVGDGETAIAQLKQGQHDFKLIILDIMLPIGRPEGVPFVGEDVRTEEMGLEILRQLRQNMNDQTPVIVLTAALDFELKNKVIGLGVKRYFTKPTSLEQFIQTVNDILTVQIPPVM